MQYISKPRFFTDFINAQRQGGYSFTYSVSGGGGLDTSSNEFNLVDGNPCNPIHFESLNSLIKFSNIKEFLLKRFWAAIWGLLPFNNV